MRFAAMIPASLAAAIASPFGSSRELGRGLRRDAQHCAGDCPPARERLAADVHHPDLTGRVHVGKLLHDPERYRRPSRSRPRRCRHALPSLRAETVAVEQVDDALEAVEHAFVVGVPPRNGHATAVEIGELDARELVEPVLRVRPAEAGFLRPAPGGLAGAVRVRDVVRPDGAGLEPACEPPRPLAGRDVQTLAPRPNEEPLASRTASSSSRKGAIVTAGPKISSSSIRASRSTPLSTVGS